MTHQYLLRFDGPAQADQAVTALSRIRLGNEQVLAARIFGDAVYVGCQVFDEVDKNARVTGISQRNEPVSFFELFYAIGAVKSGRHHPEGVLWVRTGQHAVHHEQVSILDVAPTIYDLMGVRRAIGRDVIRGDSLVPTFLADSDHVRAVA